MTVPFYSNLDYLRETMRSVVAQTDPDWRAVIVDDSMAGGDVQSVLDELGDDRIELVRNETNLGVAGAFNRCFELALDRGAELAMILHADDVLEPQYIATVRAAARGVSGCDVRRSEGDRDRVGRFASSQPARHGQGDGCGPSGLPRLEGERGLQLLLRGQFFYCPAVSYRMAKIAMPAWNSRWTQVMDLELYGRILLARRLDRARADRVFRYRRHEQSMTQVNSVTMVRTVEETEVCRMLAVGGRAMGWRRAPRAGRLRLTVRLQALMRAGQLADPRGRVLPAALACGCRSWPTVPMPNGSDRLH